MTQNTSTAVMARRVEPRDSLDYYPTPPWATRALCEHVLTAHGWGHDQLKEMAACDPACGEGHMVRPLREYFRHVYASDVHDYSERFPDQESVRDFLGLDWSPPHMERRKPEWIITNPPFRLAARFVEQGRRWASIGVAMLVRTAFIEGVGRYYNLFRYRPPAIVAQFAERVPLLKGRVDPKGSTATSYCWIVWTIAPGEQTKLAWIPPCRKYLERPGDYDDLASERAA